MSQGTSKAQWAFDIPFTKKWSPDFQGAIVPKDELFMDRLRFIDPERLGMELFLRPSGEFKSSDEKAVINICKDVTIENLACQHKLPTAWLDDRNFAAWCRDQSISKQKNSIKEANGGQNPLNKDPTQIASEHLELRLIEGSPSCQSTISTYQHVQLCMEDTADTSPSKPKRYNPILRSYTNPLSAEQLYKELKKERFSHPTLPDSDRRLLSIANPDRFYLTAIAATVSQHAHEATRDMLLKYSDMKAGLNIQLTDRPRSTYTLAFHLPHFVLRQRKKRSRSKITDMPHRKAIDLSFLTGALPDEKDETVAELHPTQTSVSLCGFSETGYTVLCLHDDELDELDELDEEEDDLDDDNPDNATLKDDRVYKTLGIDANKPIWNSREYFLAIFDDWARQVLKDWTLVAGTVESAYREFSSTVSTRSDWIRPTLDLLSKLSNVLWQTNREWEQFKKDGGDWNFFSDLVVAGSAEKQRIERLLHHIQGSFAGMQCIQERLERIQVQCQEKEQSHDIRLGIQNTKNMELTILFIYPVSVIAQIFAIPDFLGFPRNGWTFAAALVVSMVIMLVLRQLSEGNFRRNATWARFMSRARAAPFGDPAITKENKAGSRIIKRRDTHVDYRL